jgi:hypothetical protein
MNKYEFVFADRETLMDRFAFTIIATDEDDAWKEFYKRYSLDDITHPEVEEFTLQEVPV